MTDNWKLLHEEYLSTLDDEEPQEWHQSKLERAEDVLQQLEDWLNERVYAREDTTVYSTLTRLGGVKELVAKFASQELAEHYIKSVTGGK